jgi:DNA-binding transcriptional ArsR family regulator
VVADAFAALADPTRRRIFEIVADSPGPVGEIAAQVSVSRPAVSQHLKVLRTAGLVMERREGTRHIYRVDRSGLGQVRAYFNHFWERSLTSYKEALERSALPEPPSRRSEK